MSSCKYFINSCYVIVERYTGAGRDEKRITFGTMRKKVRRFRQTLTQKTGLRSAVSHNHFN